MGRLKQIQPAPTLEQFILINCPYPKNLCRGPHLPNIELGKDTNKNVPDREPCEFFRKGKCWHEKHPNMNEG